MDFEQHADTIQYSDNTLSFHYDAYRTLDSCNIYTNRVVVMPDFDICMYIDIAVIAKGSMKKEGIPDLPTPQDIEINTVEKIVEKIEIK